MIPFAEECNLRLVLLNLRGYPGSTPYSDEELKRFEGTVDDPESAVQARGFEIATFLRWFIETEKIPRIHALPGSGRNVGGLSLLSWSGGNVQTLSMFANADKLPMETRELFDCHLRSFILYGESGYAHRQGFTLTRAVSQTRATLLQGPPLLQAYRPYFSTRRCLPKNRRASSAS